MRNIDIAERCGNFRNGHIGIGKQIFRAVYPGLDQVGHGSAAENVLVKGIKPGLAQVCHSCHLCHSPGVFQLAENIQTQFNEMTSVKNIDARRIRGGDSPREFDEQLMEFDFHQFRTEWLFRKEDLFHFLNDDGERFRIGRVVQRVRLNPVFLQDLFSVLTEMDVIIVEGLGGVKFLRSINIIHDTRVGKRTNGFAFYKDVDRVKKVQKGI